MSIPSQRTGQAPAPGASPSAPAPAPNSPFRGLGRSFDAALARGLGHITRRALGPYQTAIVRIGFAVTVLGFLLHEWPNRRLMYGPDSAWSFDMASRFVENSGAFTLLLWSDSGLWFELVYHLTIAAAVAMLLGWRTRAASMLFMIGILSVQNRSIFMGDGGDNVIHLMAMYLVLTRCGQVWSLDARRRARRPDLGPSDDRVGIVLWAVLGVALLAALVSGSVDSWIWSLFLSGMWLVHGYWWLIRRYAPGEPRVVSDIVANLVHNAALLMIMAEVCVIYATAGWYKIQGSRWQDGTAVYYPMNLDYFNVWPEVSELLSSSGPMIMVLSYGTVIVQVAFPFALLNRRAKNVLLVLMMGEHIGIALLMGLPFFSLAMIAMDAVFLPTAFLLWMGARASGLRARLTRRKPAPPEAPPPPAPAEQRPPAWAAKG
ncbi:HTTM domain-containing protein [Streptomyces sp. PT12]|uniref:HTTM domain-containing protein n=1 Tax=Streptomyces sp. PT12 TaxID=1510197 RepID=UPI0015EE4484|nr:HTTM domain-containing protein [Streptomyces sp. PT12]